MKAFAETEKAVKLRIVIDYYNVEKFGTHEVWVPKSQLRNGEPTEWITSVKTDEVVRRGGEFSHWEDADGVVIPVAGAAERQAKFDAACRAYDALIERAKAAGIKGVRKGLKRATIEAKLTAAGIAC